MPVEPAVSAADSMVAHLAATVEVTYDGVTGPLRVVRGWGEDNQDYDLTSGPVASVTPISTRSDYHTPYTIDRAATVNWKVADLDITLQMDLWAPNRYTRDEVAELMTRALSNDVPYRPELYLTHADYYGRPICVIASDRRVYNSDRMTPSVAEWRCVWDLRVQSGLIIQAATPQQLNWTLRLHANSVLLPDITITP